MKYIAILIISTVLFFLYQYFLWEKNIIKIENIVTHSDVDSDWLNDIDDILQGARAEVKNKTNYRSAYYAGWYPPENEGVCNDVIRRALKNAGYDLKAMVDGDIQKNISSYPRVNGKADPNIDFRRVPNLQSYFSRHAENLPLEVIPWDVENLSQWQPGDIVIFWKPKDHIAIISDKRNKQGVPYIIHNSAPYPREDDWLVYWNTEVSPIIGHYRLNYFDIVVE